MTVWQALLLEARARAGLNQAGLAKKAGIPRSVLNAYERGKREPGAEALVHLLDSAGFDLSLRPKIDLERAGRILEEVIDLAEALPYRPRRKLTFPSLRKRGA